MSVRSLLLLCLALPLTAVADGDTTPPADPSRTADRLIEGMRSNAQVVQELAEAEAGRRAPDPAKLACLESKRGALEAVLVAAEQAEVRIDDAVAAGRLERARTDVRALRVTSDRAGMLRAEAEGCGSDGGTGATTIKVTYRAEEDEAPPDPERDAGDAPPDASPYQ